MSAKETVSSTSSGGIGFAGVLTILFIGLKLTGHIDWSWWWVLSPLWIGLALLAAVCVVALVIYVVFALIAALVMPKRKTGSRR